MKIFKSMLYFVVIPIVVIGILAAAGNWVKLTFFSDKSITVRADATDISVPLPDKSEVKFRTSDNSYVCHSSADIEDMIRFYADEGQYKALYSTNNTVFLQNDTSEISIKILSRDFNLITYSIRYEPRRDSAAVFLYLYNFVNLRLRV